MKPLNEESDKKKLILEKYNSTSSFYDDRYKNIQNQKYEIQFKSTDFRNKILLDAGCGTGLLFEYIYDLKLSNINRTLNYIGLDISWKMLQQFYNKTKKLNYLWKINLVLGDIENLPFREGRFNLILSITALQNLQNLKNALEELFRVGREDAALKLSILRKQLKLEELLTYLNSHMNNLILENFEEIEDIIIRGKLVKD